MAKAEEKKVQEPGRDAETPSMEEILQSIRGVISGDDAASEDSNSDSGAEEVLELTDLVEETPAEDATAADSISLGSASEKSILDDIDAALDTGPDEKKSETLEASVQAVTEPENEVQEPEISNKSPGSSDDKSDNASMVAESKSAVKDDNNDDIDDDDMLEADQDAESVQYDESFSTKNKSERLLGHYAAKESSGSLKRLVNSMHERGVDSPHTRGGTSLEDLVIEAMKPFLAEWLNKNLPIIVKKIVAKEVKRLIPKEEDDD